MRKKMLLLLIFTVFLGMTGCKKNNSVSLERVGVQSDSDSMEEYGESSQVQFQTVNEMIYHKNMDGVPEEESERIKNESLNYLSEFVDIVFNYHGEADLKDRLLPYFGEQGKFQNHDYTFPDLVQKEFQRKNINMTYKDMFISGLYLQVYNTDINQYVLSFSGYVTTDMSSNTISQGTYCNTICGVLMYDSGKWQIAQFRLEYVRTSPCEVKAIDANIGTFQYMGDMVALWEVNNADSNAAQATQTDISVDEEQSISFNGDKDSVIKDEQ